MHNSSHYRGKPVESLQYMLRRISDVDTTVLPVIPNGLYEENTYASVLSFQQSNKLPLTGEVDLLTWTSIAAAYDSLRPYTEVPAIFPTWDSTQTVPPGDYNYHLYLAQAMLSVIAEFLADFPTPPVNGVLNTATKEGLLRIQKTANLSPTGALDNATWHYLSALYRALSENGVKK